MGEKVNELLVINYQELLVLVNKITVSWIASDTCSYSFQLEGHTLHTGGLMLSREHVSDVGQAMFAVVPRTNSDISYKIVAQNSTGAICPSTQNIYYSFEGSLYVDLLFSTQNWKCIGLFLAGFVL